MMTKIEQAAALFNAGKLPEAARLCEELLAADRFDVAALHQSALVEARQNRFPQALALLDRALAVDGTLAALHVNRGNVLRALGRVEEALAAFDETIRLEPAMLGAWSNRGNALWRLGRDEEAIAAYRHVLDRDPDNADALLNCGRSLAELKRYDEAYACYDRLLARTPDHFACLYNYGIALERQGRPDDALDRYRRAHALDPQHFGAAFAVLTLKMKACDWSDYESLTAQVVAGVRAGKTGLAPLNLLHFSDRAEDHLRCALSWTGSEHPPEPVLLWSGERYRHDRIRVAYLSADFHEHPTSYLMAGLFERHDRKRFEITAVYSGAVKESAMRHRLQRAFDRFIDVPYRSDREVALLLRELEIDIAVDVSGHIDGARAGALAFRPAPVAVNYLGYPGTMGAGYIDYILADRWIVPEENRPYFSEKIVYLPDTYQVNDDRRSVAAHAPARAALGLPERGFVFCSFNRSNKITPLIFDLWMRLLAAVPGSVLWLLASGAAATENLRHEARRRGVTPERLVFAPPVPQADHIARLRCADLFLDTAPYNAHTSASDALLVGLPVLTCPGKSFPSRVAASLLHAVGLPELIAPTFDDYRALALQLATDPAALAALKARLVANGKTAPLFDTDRFRRHIEAAYVAMHRRAGQGLPPEAFTVEETAP